MPHAQRMESLQRASVKSSRKRGRPSASSKCSRQGVPWRLPMASSKTSLRTIYSAAWSHPGWSQNLTATSEAMGGEGRGLGRSLYFPYPQIHFPQELVFLLPFPQTSVSIVADRKNFYVHKLPCQ